jgi:DNA-binding response OmpR family regulator
MAVEGGTPLKILVADDDRELVNILNYWLKSCGYDVVSAFDGEQAIECWRKTHPDLVLLDVKMPRRNGFDVCRQMSSETNALIIFLTAYDREDDEVRGLEVGADDYVRKPFSPRQLLARINSLTRRLSEMQQTSHSPNITIGALTLNTMHHEVSRDGVKMRLTPIESRLLHLLITNVGQVLTTRIIIERVWDPNGLPEPTSLKSHIRHLRQKVEPDPDHPRSIITIPGVGYTFTSRE